MTGSYSLRDSEFRKWIWRLMVPLALQQLLLTGVNIVNSLMFGRFGELEIAASTQATNIVSIFITACYAFSGTGRILASQYWGKRDPRSIRTVIGISLRYTLIETSLFAFLFLTVPKTIMGFFSSDPEVVALGAVYLRIVAVGLYFYSISNLIYQTESALEKPQYTLVGSLISYPCNILVNYILIFGKLGFRPMGLAGAAIGYLTGRAIDFIFTVSIFARDKRIGFRPRDIFERNKLLSKDYFNVLKPIFAHEVTWGVANSMGAIITGQLSTIAVTAYNICYMYDTLVVALVHGMGGAAGAIIGKILGSDDIDGAKRASRTLLTYAGLLGGILAVFLLLTGRVFIGFYNISSETVALARTLMYIFSVNVFCQAFEIVGLIGILRAGGSGHVGFWTDIAFMWGVAIPLGWLSAFMWKLSPILVVILNRVDMPIKATVGIITILRMKWLKNLTRENPTE